MRVIDQSSNHRRACAPQRKPGPMDRSAPNFTGVID